MKFRVTYTVEADSLAEAVVEFAYPALDINDQHDTSKFSDLWIEAVER
jgi:hypothetical protein